MYIITKITTGIRSKLVFELYNDIFKKNNKVLDVGCGDGLLSEILQKKYSIKITGCDIQQYLKKDISFVLLKESSKLPFPDNSFDIVMFNDILHHTTFHNQEKLIKEALRISKKVLIFEDEPTIVGSIIDWSINKLHNFQMPVLLTFKTYNQWLELFSKLKIVYEYKEVSRPFLYPIKHIAFVLKNQ